MKVKFLRHLPAEMRVYKQVAFITRQTPISNEDKEILANMIAINKEDRTHKDSGERKD